VQHVNGAADAGRLASTEDETGRRVVDDHLDVPLEDATLMEEVELISTLMIAASEAEGDMDQAQIDQLLGVADASAQDRSEGSG
jgi:hypothetical protein